MYKKQIEKVIKISILKKDVNKDSKILKRMVINATTKTTMSLQEWAELFYLLKSFPELRVSKILTPDIQILLDDAEKIYGNIAPVLQ